jgi:hypothetical protein
MVKGQMAAHDERSSETCLNFGISDAVQEDVAGQEKADPVALAANLGEAGTWYYVVDCATCKAVVPFKYAPEGEPIVCFPTMNVRCFQCNTDHTYAADLISHRKAAAPCGISKRDRPPSHASDGDREASRDPQEDRGAGDSEGRVIIDGNIDPISASLRCKNILNVVVSGKRATIFFLSSCFFAAGWVSHVALDIFYPAVLELRSSGLPMLLGIASFGTVLLGLALFVFGSGSYFVEAFGFERRSIKRGFARIDPRIANLAVHAASTVMLFLTETWHRKFPTRELPRALAGLALQSRSMCKGFEPIPFKQAPSPEDKPESCPGNGHNWLWLLARGRSQNQSHSP